MPSKIEWTDETWNPVVGCTKCSPGCLNCYAERMAIRLAHMKATGEKYSKVIGDNMRGGYFWNGEIFCDEPTLDKPLHWRKSRRIFVCSMSDLFHPKVPFGFIDRIYGVMREAKQHTFQVLTKRPKVLYEYCEQRGRGTWSSNIHLGVSISNQAEADEKIPILLQIPTAVRWLSIEPMLGQIDLTKVWWETNGLGELHENFNAWVGIHGVIVGGESGKGARPMHPDWPRNIRDQCIAANVPFYFKQWGEWLSGRDKYALKINTYQHYYPKRVIRVENTTYFRVGKKKAGCLLDGKIWKQLPERK